MCADSCILYISTCIQSLAEGEVLNVKASSRKAVNQNIVNLILTKKVGKMEAN